MAKIHYLNGSLAGKPEVREIADALADAVKESTGFLMDSKDDLYYELRFNYNRSWFRLYNIDNSAHIVSANIELIVNDKIKWSDYLSKVSIQFIRDFFKKLFEDGISQGSMTWFWGSTACACQNLAPDVDPDDGWGDGSDLDQFANWDTGTTFEETQGDDSSDETPEAGGSRFGSPFGAVKQSIVPDGIKSVRVVALKYNNQVIAFRFKTDKGTFDMRRDVAESHGLGSFKTETFIALESVNGLLMSGSERKRKSLIPDVSDCQVDCFKLINAVFGR